MKTAVATIEIAEFVKSKIYIASNVIIFPTGMYSRSFLYSFIGSVGRNSDFEINDSEKNETMAKHQLII